MVISRFGSGPLGKVMYTRQTELQMTDNWKDEIKAHFQNEEKTSNIRCLVPGRAFVFWRDGMMTHVIRFPKGILFVSRRGEEPLMGKFRSGRNLSWKKEEDTTSEPANGNGDVQQNGSSTAEDVGVNIQTGGGCSGGVCPL